MTRPRSWPELLAQLRTPLALAPMAGGVGTPALAAAVTRAGGLGSLGGAYLTPQALRDAIREVRALTDGPLLVNLFAPQPVPAVTPDAVAVATAELRPFHDALNLPPPTLPERVQEDFSAQLNVVLEERPEVFSVAFGPVPPDALAALRARGILTVGTATSLSEALALHESGVDAVTVQGGAAGGHRGGWQDDPLADTLTLVREVARATPLPVLAAGGLMTAGHVRAARAAGATLAQCGTAFLLANEAGTSAPYRQAIRDGTRDTVLTRAYSGRAARGLRTALTDAVTHPLPFPHQNALTRPLRTAGAQEGRQADVLSLWAGTGYRQAQATGAAQIVAGLTP
ncbi:NAD(P)H-dependent flavin oxidoreductase [Deinococcus soli (ex Cha et al. 2016)]|uniref:Propionate 3-nitronate monooxygenase n=1 Tax=Deinococcus soli (ex Cha et al. 2016) TaxID=1309411 RepID=A0A0F7JJB8_9DEIO|nr:nitronate monooxygenase [Deinococcus soli (ex Cha et al. 2016)]AKH15802.1 2-nitropropane dioxygenase [Deinococcus soli (ex Cha et al. 2016)]